MRPLILSLTVLAQIFCAVLQAASSAPTYEAAVFDTDPESNGWLIRFFPLGDGKELDVRLPGSLRPVAVPAPGRVLYASPSPRAGRLEPPAPGIFAIDLATKGVSPVPGSASFVFPTDLAVSSDRRKLLISGASMTGDRAICGVYEAVPDTGEVRRLLSADSCRPEDAWSALSFSPDGKRATAILHRQLEILSVDSGATTAVRGRFYGAAWSPNGEWIAAREENNGRLQTVLLDARRFEPARTLPDAEMLWSSDSRYLLAFRVLAGCFADFHSLVRVDVQNGATSVIESSKCKAAGGQAAWVDAGNP